MAKILKVPKIDITLIDQPFTLMLGSEEAERPFNRLFRISSCGGGADLDNQVWEFCERSPFSMYIFSLDEATCKAREKTHATHALSQSLDNYYTTAFYPGNNLQLLLELNPNCDHSSTPLLLLRLCDCKQRCEGKTRIDTTVLKTFVSRLELTFGEVTTFQKLSFYPACTENYQIGRKNEPGNYKEILYYAFLNRKILLDIFPLEVFSKDFKGSPPTIQILHPTADSPMMGHPPEDVPMDVLQRWIYYKHESLLKTCPLDLAFDLLKTGLNFKMLDVTVHSSQRIKEKIEGGEWLHPKYLWRIYGIVRHNKKIEIVVMLKMTVVKALKKALMKKTKIRACVQTYVADAAVDSVRTKKTEGKIKDFSKKHWKRKGMDEGGENLK